MNHKQKALACMIISIDLKKARTMKHKSPSTFEREMQNPELKEQFENEYREFVLSELPIALIEDDNRVSI
jgi:hypothetical protein